MSRHVLLDTNLLLLYIVGLHSVDAIAQVRRVRPYTLADFKVLIGLLRNASGLVLTPNTVTETSNLLHSGPDTLAIRGATLHLADLLERFDERYVESAAALARPDVVTLGVADCVLLTLCQPGVVLLTSDNKLWETARQAGLEAVNFNHERQSQRYRNASRH